MVIVNAPQVAVSAEIKLPGSKSISNRLLVMKHLSKAGTEIENLSDSEDTRLLMHALEKISAGENVININHAGTNMRFLAAVLSITPGTWTITGSQRMLERPVGPLVDALRALGASIEYMGMEGFPPLKINGTNLGGGTVSLDASMSSQFTSALLMIAPFLKKGLRLEMHGDIVSASYIGMTISMLREFGAAIVQEGTAIVVQPQPLQMPLWYVVESDWSAASYWFSTCALCPGSVVILKGLFQNSLQPDSILPQIYQKLGVNAADGPRGLVLGHSARSSEQLELDLLECPDIAQTIIVTALGRGIRLSLQGLRTLSIKESNRLLAMESEVSKLGGKITAGNDSIELERCDVIRRNVEIDTYNDHRMAMSFAPLAGVIGHIAIRDPEVVDKSYPQYWRDLQQAGFSVNLQP